MKSIKINNLSQQKFKNRIIKLHANNHQYPHFLRFGVWRSMKLNNSNKMSESECNFALFYAIITHPRNGCCKSRQRFESQQDLAFKKDHVISLFLRPTAEAFRFILILFFFDKIMSIELQQKKHSTLWVHTNLYPIFLFLFYI